MCIYLYHASRRAIGAFPSAAVPPRDRWRRRKRARRRREPASSPKTHESAGRTALHPLTAHAGRRAISSISRVFVGPGAQLTTTPAGFGRARRPSRPRYSRGARPETRPTFPARARGSAVAGARSRERASAASAWSSAPIGVPISCLRFVRTCGAFSRSRRRDHPGSSGVWSAERSGRAWFFADARCSRVSSRPC